MKISKREKIMLATLLLVIFIGGVYRFIYTPSIGKIKELQLKAENDKLKINKENQDKVLLKKLQENIKILNAKSYDNSNDFFPDIRQDKIIVILNDMIEKAGIKCEAISFSEKSLEAISGNRNAENEKTNALNDLVDQYNNLDNGTAVASNGNSKTENNNNGAASEPAKNNSTDTNIQAEKITANLSFSGNYDNIISFIDEIKGFYKRIIIKNLNIAGAEGVITGSVNLEFYAVPKLVKEDIDYLNWEYEGDYGKDNPFGGSLIGNTGAAQGTAEAAAQAVKKYDFLMSIRPMSSDLPTIMLGKAKDSEKSTYVYADKDAVENIEMYFMQKDNKYYYKYKTSRDTFPKNFNTLAEFTPNEKDINFKIYSEERTSDKDMAGANILIFNETNLKLNIDINKDDKNRPRINILKQEGNIEVNRN